MAEYTEYKDSGIPWIGRIPSHWGVTSLRAFLEPTSDKGHEEMPLLSVTRERGIILRGEKGDDDNNNVIPEDLSNYKLVDVGDFVINKMKSWQGSYGLSDYRGIVSPAYFTYHLHFPNRSFFSRALRSKSYIPFFMQYSKGIRVDQWDLKPIAIKNIPFFVPPVDEQEAIVEYLDKVTADIDNAIAAKERIIASLEERRKIIITHAVTRGINPDASLRDSGIDWLGQIPAHWETRKLKYLARLKSGKNLTSEDISPEVFEGSVPVYGGNGIRGFYRVANTHGDYVIIGRQGALCGNVNYAHGDFWATDHAVVCYPLIDFPLLWFGEMLKVSNLNQYATQSAQPGLSVERIKKVEMPFPPSEEIQEINTYLSEIANKFERPIAQQKKLIELLRERKNIIINETVTGKVKVI